MVDTTTKEYKVGQIKKVAEEIRFDKFVNLESYTWAAAFTSNDKTENLNYMIHGLVNEAGEVSGKWKKHLRGDYDLDTAKEKIADELGDVFWYIAGICRRLDIEPYEILSMNLDKISSRLERDKIQGDGDAR